MRAAHSPLHRFCAPHKFSLTISQIRLLAQPGGFLFGDIALCKPSPVTGDSAAMAFFAAEKAAIQT
jgi:hypothetical protein